MDPNSPFEIFVRELVAMDGVDSSEITLIDSDGCPTEHFIMGPLYKAAPSGKVMINAIELCSYSFYKKNCLDFNNLQYIYDDRKINTLH